MSFAHPTRRSVLVAAPALLGFGGCASGADRFLCPQDPSISDASAPLTIDVHSHVFNGSDLQIREFLTQTVEDSSELQSLVSGLGGLLQFLAWETAPDADAEHRMLDAHVSQLKACATRDRRSLALPYFRQGYDLGVQALNDAVTAAKANASSGGPTILGGSVQTLPPGVEDAVRQLSQEDPETFKAKLNAPLGILGSQASIGGYLNFVIHNFNYRYINVLDYLATYSTYSPRKIDLMVSSMVDYDWWLAQGRATHTPLEKQVDVMARIAVMTGGRVHGFAPFCPFREAMTRDSSGVGDSLRLVQRAVLKQGFIGVKLYPPMGFAAYGNTGLDVWRGKPRLPAIASDPRFGAMLDASMDALFTWCSANDVPIMAHTNLSNGPNEEFRALAGSAHWKPALDKYKGLRVSFGHLGDTDLEDHDGSRAGAFVRLMSQSPGSPGERAFADSGYFAGVLQDADSLETALQKLYAQVPSGILANRFMYGTDWEMILTQKSVDRYLANFISVMKRLDAAGGSARGDPLSEGFFSKNAVAFLGLAPGQPNRLRLAEFYKQNSVATPDWMSKIG